MDTEAALRVLAGLAQPSRLAVVRYLVERGAIGAYAGQLAEDIGASPATLSFHLKELVHARMIAAHHEGRFIRYVVDFDVMNGLIAYLTHNCCGGRTECFPDSGQCKPAKAGAKKRAAAPRKTSALKKAG